MTITKRSFLITIWLIAAILIIYALMNISHQVKTLENKLGNINSDIKKEGNKIRTLNAEWSYLTGPDRIESLSAKLLPHLTIVKAIDISDLDTMEQSSNVIAISDETSNSKSVIKVFVGNVE